MFANTFLIYIHSFGTIDTKFGTLIELAKENAVVKFFSKKMIFRKKVKKFENEKNLKKISKKRFFKNIFGRYINCAAGAVE